MPPIIIDQPWPPDAGEDLHHPNGQLVVCPTTGRILRTYHDQIILWATLSASVLSVPPADPPLFPVVLDTGFNNTFLMQQRQAEVWVTPAIFATFPAPRRWLQIGRERIPYWNLALWIYPNVPGTRIPDTASSPTWINLPQGVLLTPPGSAATKEKPLLGLRAIRFNGLSLRIDGQRGTVSLDAP
jgi:hypothetical protein